MESAFRYFGGIPYCIVCDNASSLVRDHYANDDALKFTERFYHFLQYWGIKGIATAYGLLASGYCLPPKPALYP